MRKLQLVAAAIAILVGMAMTLNIQTAAASPADQAQNGVNQIGGNETGPNSSPGAMIKRIVNVMLYILGAIAVVMVIYGGIRYVISRGEASEVAAAKNTIFYAVIGVIVALLAYAIVNFVVGQLQSKTPANATTSGPKV